MTTSSVRRAVVLVVAVLLVALSVTGGLAAPAVADASGGVPGVPRADATALSVGAEFGCAIVGDGSVRCWGDNAYGQLAQGNTADIGDSPGESTVRVDLGTGRTATAVSAGDYHACAILDTGQLRCWGYNDSGELGQGNTQRIGDSPGETTVAVNLGPGRTAVAVDAGGFHTCAILDTGQLVCWGSNTYGQLGQGNTTGIGDSAGETTVAVNLGPGRSAVAVSAGGATTCAILDTGQLRCWGSNSYGQLLQGNTASIGDGAGETTVAVDLSGRPAAAVSVGSSHVCSVRDDGQLRCWGGSNHGQLGAGRNTPFGDGVGETSGIVVELPPGRTAGAVTTGELHTCAVLDTGQLHCWGDGFSGKLGQGDTETYGDDPGEGPRPVAIDSPAHAVSVGSNFSCAVTATGLRCWGAGGAGQLAQGSAADFGKTAGQVPTILPAINLGGQQVGRDTDGDGVRDAVDACPIAAGPLANGCAPAVPPEAVLKGKKVLLDTVLTKKKASAKCPAKATVTVRTKSKKGPVRVSKQLRTKSVATGCRVSGKVTLPVKPKKSAAVKVAVKGTKLKTKHLTAVRTP